MPGLKLVMQLGMTELTLLASIPEHWDSRHTSLHLAYVVQGIEPN